YQFNIRKLNSQIHSIFDKLKTETKEEDIYWIKCLNEIDIRNWEAQSYDEKVGGFIVQPQYDKKVAKQLASEQGNIKKQNKSTKFSSLISKVYNNEKCIHYDKWEEFYNYYKNPENLDIILSKPITLAVLGLRDFPNEISDEQKEWCLETIVNAV